MTSQGKRVRRETCDTTIPTIVERLKAVRRRRRLTFEEGPLADWLARELRSHVDELVVCEPRRNHWIARDGDKDDPMDAFKLAELYRGGYLKAVHQVNSLERSLLKQQVLLYHDRVRERVRQGNQLAGLCRRHGVFVRAAILLDDAVWQRSLDSLPGDALLRCGWQYVRETYDLLWSREDILRRSLVGVARNIAEVQRFAALPGIGWIRGVTFYALIDTPHRFRSKAALWRYCGIGLERRHSGNGPVRTRLSRQGHRRLKDVLLGAAKSAIALGDNPFADKYETWREQGLHASNAKRNVARALTATMWSLWKNGQAYDPDRVVRGATSDLQT
ncbi:MAG: IS110 family transposase [Planctomycetia bacterium]|nr:IS110 family transposase [Planctomycetia bacterium]